MLGGEATRQIDAELRLQQRNAVLAATLVTDRVFNDDFGQAAAILELDGQRIGDRTLVRIMVIGRECGIFHANDLVAQGIDARIGCNGVFIVTCSQAAIQHRHRNHVLDAVIAVGWIVQRALLVDDADACFVGTNGDPGDVV